MTHDVPALVSAPAASQNAWHLEEVPKIHVLRSLRAICDAPVIHSYTLPLQGKMCEDSWRFGDTMAAMAFDES